MHRKLRWVAVNPVSELQISREVSGRLAFQPLCAKNPGWVRRPPCADAAIAQNRRDRRRRTHKQDWFALPASRGGRVSEATLLQLRRVLADTVLFEQAAEMPAFGAAYSCGSGYVAIGLLEQAREVAALELYDRLAFGALVIQGGPGGCHVAGPRQPRGRGWDANLRAFGQEECSKNEILKFANVARPGIAFKPVQRRGIELPLRLAENARCRP